MFTKTYNNSNYKGFLLIELMVALGVLGIIISIIGKYQCDILLYKKASEQLYVATNLCSDAIEEIWLKQGRPKNFFKKVKEFKVVGRFIPGTANAFYKGHIYVTWKSVIGGSKTIKMDIICVP